MDGLERIRRWIEQNSDGTNREMILGIYTSNGIFYLLNYVLRKVGPRPFRKTTEPEY